VVFEKRDDAQDTGAGLQLSPNASHILLRWGLGPELAKSAVAPTELAIRRWGEPRAYAHMPFVTQDAPFWVTMRADLHNALKTAALRLPGISLKNGYALERIIEAPSHMKLRFGLADAPFDMDALCLIGADGQRSMTRRLLGDARDLDRPGWEAWRTVMPANSVANFATKAATNLWLGRDSHAVHYPVAGGRSVNLIVIRRSATATDGWSREGDPAELEQLKMRAAEPLRDLMHAAPYWKVWTLFDRHPSPYLAKGLGALVGDAAHPVLPFLAQGAAMAVEDAEVLALNLPLPAQATPERMRASLKAYAAQRGSRVTRVFKAARANAFAYHLPAPLAVVRDWRMAQLGADGMRQRYAWLYDWRAVAVES
jgi:salicylate hydroxylase